MSIETVVTVSPYLSWAIGLAQLREQVRSISPEERDCVIGTG